MQNEQNRCLIKPTMMGHHYMVICKNYLICIFVNVKVKGQILQFFKKKKSIFKVFGPLKQSKLIIFYVYMFLRILFIKLVRSKKKFGIRVSMVTKYLTKLANLYQNNHSLVNHINFVRKLQHG